MVRLHRTLKNMTLRQLADASGLSHTMLNKIELGQSVVTESTLQSINNAFSHIFQFDEAVEADFESAKKAVHDAVYQGNLERSLELMKTIDAQKSYHMLAPTMVEYMIIVLAMYSYPRFGRREEADRYLRVLEKASSLMTIKQRQYFYLYIGAFHYYNRDYERALNYIDTAFELRETTSHAALFNYSRAMASSELYKIHRADMHFKAALRGYEKSNTVKRVMACRLFLAVNRIKIYDYKPFFSELPYVISYAEQTMNYQLKNTALHYKMIIRVLQNNYKDAIAVAKQVDNKNEAFYFYYAYAALLINDRPLFNKLIKQAENYGANVENETYTKPGLRFLHAISKHAIEDASHYQQVLSEYFDVTVKQRDYLRTKIVYAYLNRYFVDTRQYKKAFELTDTMQRIVSQTMQ